MTRTLIDDKLYLQVYAEAERNAKHHLFVQAHVYRGNIERLIEDTLNDLAHRLPYDVLQRVTATDLRDVAVSAAHEATVAWYRRDTVA